MINENEIKELERLNENPVLVEAIRKVFFSEIKQLEDAILDEKPFSNERLGEITRGQMAGVKLLNDGFKKLKSYKKVEENKLEINNAI